MAKYLSYDGLAYFWDKIKALVATKADTATTLTGYGITDAYTKTEVDTAIANASGVGTVVFKYVKLEASKWNGNSYTFSDYTYQTNYDIEVILNIAQASDAGILAYKNAMFTYSFWNDLVAQGTVPTVDIPVILKVVKK